MAPKSAAGQQTATGLTPEWQSISIVAWALPTAFWAPPSVREPVAIQLALPAAPVEPLAGQAVEPPLGQAVTARPTAGAMVPARPTAGAVVPAAVVLVRKVEQVSGRYSPMPEKVLAPGLAMARSVAALAPLPAETLRWAQRTAERAG